VAEIVRPIWMSEVMYQEWLGYYTEAGGEAGGDESRNRATEEFRASDTYESYFPGIKRDDGAIRYAESPELTYHSNLASYRNAVEATGIVDASIFEDGFIELIKGDVSPNEFAQRTSAIYNRVLEAGPGIRDYYAGEFGIDMTREGIIASLLDEKVQTDILNKNITMAEIGGTAIDRGFDLTSEFVNMLANEGMDRGEARKLFGTAERMLPMLQSLATRHGDSDDTFDITEFTEAGYLDDPEQMSRINRLQAQEQASFTDVGGIARSRETGGLTGLTKG